MKLLRAVSDILDAAELSLVALLGAALFVGLVLGLPAMLAWTLYSEGRVIPAALFLALPVLMVLAVVRDLRTGRLSWLSAALGALWLVCTVYVGVRLLLV
jgi:hypothetical protein